MFSCMYVQHFCLVSTEVTKVSGSLGTGVTDSCEPPCGCWESISGPLEEQPLLLAAEPSLQPLFYPQLLRSQSLKKKPKHWVVVVAIFTSSTPEAEVGDPPKFEVSLVYRVILSSRTTRAA